jgi:hypothetical protein
MALLSFKDPQLVAHLFSLAIVLLLRGIIGVRSWPAALAGRFIFSDNLIEFSRRPFIRALLDRTAGRQISRYERI